MNIMDGILSFIENEVKWCEGHSNDATYAEPSPDFKAGLQTGFIMGLEQVRDFIKDNSELLKIE